MNRSPILVFGSILKTARVKEIREMLPLFGPKLVEPMRGRMNTRQSSIRCSLGFRRDCVFQQWRELNAIRLALCCRPADTELRIHWPPLFGQLLPIRWIIRLHSPDNNIAPSVPELPPYIQQFTGFSSTFCRLLKRGLPFSMRPAAEWTVTTKCKTVSSDSAKIVNCE